MTDRMPDLQSVQRKDTFPCEPAGAHADDGAREPGIGPWQLTEPPVLRSANQLVRR